MGELSVVNVSWLVASPVPTSDLGPILKIKNAGERYAMLVLSNQIDYSKIFNQSDCFKQV